MHRRFYPDIAKRTADLIVALVSLLVLAPLLVVIALAVRVFLGTPVLYRQYRPGRNGRPFLMVKFRTMTDACNSDGNLLSDAVSSHAIW